MKKHENFRLVFILILFFLLFNIALFCYEKVTGSLLYLGGVTGYAVHIVLSVIAAVLLIIFAFKNKFRIESKICLTLVALFIIGFFSISNFFGLIGVMDSTFYNISDQSSDRKIIAEEFNSGDVNIFVQTNSAFIKQVDSSTYFGEIAPFKDGLYAVEWDESGATITYPVSSFNPSQVEKIHIDFSKH